MSNDDEGDHVVLNLQGRGISQAGIHHEAGSKQSRASGWFLAWLIRR
jgi:hypothetical protein